ncbi:unnamed protein product [Musa textilis]
MKPRQSGVRQFGQTSLPLSFFSKSGVPDEHHLKRSSDKQPVPLSEFLNRKLIKTTDRSVEEKNNRKSPEEGESKESQLESYTGGGDNSRKRKNPFDSSGFFPGAGERVRARKSVIVLGDDPKPWRSRRGETTVETKNKPLYDHYATGSGWWDCSKEGVDSEEVGCNDFWEGMGSTTLGGLEWH